MRIPLCLPGIRWFAPTAACLLVALGPARGQCPPADPEAVLKCCAIALADRDLEAYASLLTPDFVRREGSVERSRAEELETTERLFAEGSIRVEIDGGYRLLRGEGPRTWRIVDLVVRMEVTTPDGGTYDVSRPWAFMEIVETPGVGYRIRVLEAP